jgi:LPS export ABC transporter protein LptC
MISIITRYFLKAALFMGCFFVYSCENDISEVNNFMKKKTGVEEALDVNIYLSKEGIMKARLQSPFMLRHLEEPSKTGVDSPYVEFPRTLHVDFYNDSLKIESMLDAHYARYREYEDKVYLKDSVVVINIEKRDTLKTDELWWDQNTQEFYTDKNVRIYEPDKTIFGTGLRAKQDLTSYDIFNITGVVLTSGNLE